MSEFWRATPRIVANAIGGYRRRRGWLAWHVAALGRFEFKGGFPDIEVLQGDLAWGQRPEQSQAEIGAAMDAWERATAGLAEEA